MKILVISTVALIVAGGTWTWVSPKSERTELGPVANQDVDERIGLKRMLTERSDLNFVNLVVGFDSDGLRAFRARVVEDAHARPVFGQARRICESAPDVAECWEIATLKIDGETRALGQQAPVNVSGTVTSSPSDVTEEEIETSDIPRQVETPIVAIAEVPGASDDVDAKKRPDATHLVARPIINVRSGPGLSNQVLFKLTKGDRLTLISEEHGWGEFVVLDGDEPGSKAWASLSILEDLR